VKKESLDKINRLLERRNKIDMLIEQGKKINRSMELFNSRWEEQLRMRGDDKDGTKKTFNDHSEMINQLNKKLDALSLEPLAYRRLPQSLESQNTSDQRHQEAPEIIFSGSMNNSIFQIRDDRKFRKELLK